MGFDLLILAFLTASLCALLWQIGKEDVARLVIPNKLVAAIAGLGMIACLVSAPDALALRAIWTIVLFALGLVFSLLAAQVMGRPALGMGDVKLFAASTFWIGPAMMGLMLAAAAGSALIVAVLRGQTDGRLAFGPYLSAALLGLWCLKLLQGASG